MADQEPLAALLRVLHLVDLLRWPALCALLTTSIVGGVLGLAFWSGALPLLAADAEMDARPPAGNFFLLAARGFPRVLGAGTLAWLLSLVFGVGCALAAVAAIPLLALRPSAGLLAAVAFLAALSLVGGVVIDLLAKLMIVRSAALGDGVVASFSRAANLLGSRLSACLVIALAFLVLELIVGALAGLFSGLVSGGDLVDANRALLSLGPRLAVALAGGVVFSWLEVGRQGALAALAADAEGLLSLTPEPAHQPEPAPRVLERPRAQPEAIIEARPVEEEAAPEAEPVIDALPVPDGEPVAEEPKKL